MKHQTALYLMTTETTDHTLEEAAKQALANDTHLRCLLMLLAPAIPYNTYGGLPYAGTAGVEGWTVMVEEARSELATRATRLEQVLAEIGASGDIRPVLTSQMDISRYVAASARTVDIACLAPNLRQDNQIFREAVHAILFQSPVGVLLNVVKMKLPKRIFIAWNDSPAAATAVHAARPLLEGADDVIVGCFDPSTIFETDEAEPGVDLAAWLSHAGCKVTVSQYPSGGREIGDCILQHATETGSDLIVMGAYGHSRMRQAVFGGTTRTMLKETETPIFMAH
ncbi:MAG: universal stress protein [Pseudomonadota bacterium]